MLHIWKHWHFSQTVSFIKSSLFPKHNLLQFNLILVPSKTLKHWFCGKWSVHLQAHATLPSSAGGWKNHTVKVTLGQSGMASFSPVSCDSIFLLNLMELFLLYSDLLFKWKMTLANLLFSCLLEFSTSWNPLERASVYLTHFLLTTY